MSLNKSCGSDGAVAPGRSRWSATYYPSFHNTGLVIDLREGADYMPDASELRLDLIDDDTDSVELAQTTQRIRESLLNLDVEDVCTVSAGPAPAGSKAVDAAVIGELLITLMQTPKLLSSIVGVLSSWVSRRASRSVTITLDGDTLELSGASDEERRAVVDTWLARHRGEPEMRTT